VELLRWEHHRRAQLLAEGFAWQKRKGQSTLAELGGRVERDAEAQRVCVGVQPQPG
jgi:hypothetical protein